MCKCRMTHKPLVYRPHERSHLDWRRMLTVARSSFPRACARQTSYPKWTTREESKTICRRSALFAKGYFAHFEKKSVFTRDCITKKVLSYLVLREQERLEPFTKIIIIIGRMNNVLWQCAGLKIAHSALFVLACTFRTVPRSWSWPVLCNWSITLFRSMLFDRKHG